jgi:hypothetical protein
MPGLGQQLAEFGGRGAVQLGKNLEEFISIALRDFTHMTVLMYMVREAREGCTAGDVAGVTSDPKPVIQAVLDRFLQLQLIREAGGFFSKKYIYQREGPRAQLVVNLIKLWEHKGAHEEILRRVLAPRK